MTSNLSAAARDALARQDAHYLPLALPASPGWDQIAAHLRHTARLFQDTQAPSPSAAACAHINALFDRSVAAMPHAPLACKRGCAHCCRQPVLLYAPEAFFLAAQVRERPQMAARVTEVAKILLKKNPVALKATKDAVRRVSEMTYENAEDYLVRAQEAANSFDDDGRKEGIKQFIDDKTFKPGIGTYDITKKT